MQETSPSLFLSRRRIDCSQTEARIIHSYLESLDGLNQMKYIYAV